MDPRLLYVKKRVNHLNGISLGLETLIYRVFSFHEMLPLKVVMIGSLLMIQDKQLRRAYLISPSLDSLYQTKEELLSVFNVEDDSIIGMANISICECVCCVHNAV